MENVVELATDNQLDQEKNEIKELTLSLKEEHSSCDDIETSEKLSNLVAKHYNELQEKGLEARKDSRIYHMRNFNNWIKSIIIGEALTEIRKEKGPAYRPHVLDIGCGKGGDLLKYKKGRIGHIVCADIAETSLAQCRERYKDRNNESCFTAEFIAADCTRERLSEKYKHSVGTFDLVSCQFAFHYCFESLTQAECMIRNVSEALRPGGFFFGTTPDGYEVMKRLRESGSHSFGNEVYSINFDEKYVDVNESIPLFGTKYNFHLEGVVDCPEFLVYFPVLVNLCDKYGLKLKFRTRFDEYYEESVVIRPEEDSLDKKNKKFQNKQLLNRMDALECFPPNSGKTLVGHTRQYQHAQEFIDRERVNRVGTLSQSEWEAITLYVLFVFEKKKLETDDEASGAHKRHKAN